MNTRELLEEVDQMTIPDVLEIAESPDILLEKGCTKLGDASDEVKRVIVLLQEKTGDLRQKDIESVRATLEQMTSFIGGKRDSIHDDLSEVELAEIIRSINTETKPSEALIRIYAEVDEIQRDINRLRQLRDEGLDEFLKKACPVHHKGIRLASDWTVWVIPRTAPPASLGDTLRGSLERNHGSNPFGDWSEDPAREKPGFEVGSSETEQGEDPSNGQSGQDVEETAERQGYSPVE